MHLDEVAGNANVIARLKRAVAEGPAHAYLFVGPAGVGKTAAALAFAADLLEAAGSPALRAAHPDLWLEDSAAESLSIDIVRPGGRAAAQSSDDAGTGGGVPAQALQTFLSLRGMHSDRRVAIMARAERLSEAAAPPLLKSIEEPPPGAVVVLCAEAVELLPETVRSRCQQVEFQRLTDAQLGTFLEARGLQLDAAALRVAAGCPGRALRLVGDSSEVERAREWAGVFAGVPGMSWLDLVVVGARFAGGDFRRNRELAREAIGVWELCLRDLVRWRAGAEAIASGAMNHEVLPAASLVDLAGLWASAQEAQDRLNNNVNPRLVVEAFLAEVALGHARHPADDYFRAGVFKSVALP